MRKKLKPLISPDRFVTTTFKLTRAQYDWLRMQSFKEALRIGKRPDASKLLRELLDELRQERP